MKHQGVFSFSPPKTSLFRKLSVFVLSLFTLSACTSWPETRPDIGDGLLGCKTENFPEAMLVSMLEKEQPSSNFQRIQIERKGQTYPGVKNLPLQQADLIRTDKNVQTLLLLKGCNVVMLDSDTSIRLVNPTTIIDLLIGLLFMDDDFNDTHKPVLVSGDSIVTPEGTEYLAKAQGHRFTVSVYRGRVRLTSRANPTTSFIIPALNQVVRTNDLEYGQLGSADSKELERARDLTDRLLQQAILTNAGSHITLDTVVKAVAISIAITAVMKESDSPDTAPGGSMAAGIAPGVAGLF